MKTYKGRGIVLHTLKYGDTSMVAYLLTDVGGRRSYMVQGVRSRSGRGSKLALFQPMFPVEFGAWEYDFETLRKKFGKEIRGMGNINKHVLSKDKKTIDREIERAQRLVDLGGFVPCFDHRIPPDAEWDLTKYYCDKMKETFWK